MCLNFSDNDLAVSLHFALFNGSTGYVLKPEEMLSTSSMGPLNSPGGGLSEENCYWPPPREMLQCVSLGIVSLHNFPKVRARPARGANACVQTAQPHL